MALSSRIDELKRRHSSLSQKVEEAQRALSSSDAEIAEMKKQKLKLKEEIERLATAPA